MASERSEDKDYVHFRVLKLLQEHPDMSQREMARRLGISNGGMHYCLNALIDKGLIKIGNFASSKHKFGYFYLLTPQGIAQKTAMTSRFLKRKLEEYEALRSEIEALQKEVREQTPAKREAAT